MIAKYNFLPSPPSLTQEAAKNKNKMRWNQEQGIKTTETNNLENKTGDDN